MPAKENRRTVKVAEKEAHACLETEWTTSEGGARGDSTSDQWPSLEPFFKPSQRPLGFQQSTVALNNKNTVTQRAAVIHRQKAFHGISIVLLTDVQVRSNTKHTFYWKWCSHQGLHELAAPLMTAGGIITLQLSLGAGQRRHLWLILQLLAAINQKCITLFGNYHNVVRSRRYKRIMSHKQAC